MYVVCVWSVWYGVWCVWYGVCVCGMMCFVCGYTQACIWYVCIKLISSSSSPAPVALLTGHEQAVITVSISVSVGTVVSATKSEVQSLCTIPSF